MCFLRVSIYSLSNPLHACMWLCCTCAYVCERESHMCACMDACPCVYERERVAECEYWLGGTALSRGHLSPAGPLALQLFRMCQRSVSQTGITTHIHAHTHIHTYAHTGSHCNERGWQIKFDIRGQRGISSHILILWYSIILYLSRSVYRGFCNSTKTQNFVWKNEAFLKKLASHSLRSSKHKGTDFCE